MSSVNPQPGGHQQPAEAWRFATGLQLPADVGAKEIGQNTMRSKAEDQDTIPTRRSLVERLKNRDDRTGWQDFFDTYWKLIYGVARRSGLTDAESQDVVQDTVISVSNKMDDFKNDPAHGSFKSWLLLIARRRISDQFRRRHRHKEVVSADPDATSRTALLERLPDPAGPALEAVWNEEWARNLTEMALANVKHQVSSKQYLLFHQQVIKQWTASKVAEKYAVSLAQVYMAKYRVGGLVRKELRKLERALA
jgi:RNA polymerase sigma-70 factor (ECF subfamily)